MEIPQYYRRQRMTVPQAGQIPFNPAQERAGEELGNVLTEFGLRAMQKINKADEIDQLNTFQVNAEKRINQHYQDLANNQDPDTFLDLAKKTEDDITAMAGRVRHKEAQTRAKQYAAGLSVDIQNGTFARMQQVKTRIMESNFTSSIEFESDRAINAPDEQTYKDATSRIIEINEGYAKAGHISPEEAQGNIKLLTQKIQERRNVLIQRRQEETVFSVAFQQLQLNPTEQGKKEAYKIVQSSSLPDKEKATILNRIDNVAAGLIETNNKAQSENAGQLQVGIWRGEITDPNRITDELSKKNISESEARILREQLTSPKKTGTESFEALVKIDDAIANPNLTKEEKRKVIFENAKYITPEKGESKLKEIDEPPKIDPEINKNLVEAVNDFQDKLFAGISASDKTDMQYERIDQYRNSLKKWIIDNPKEAADPQKFYEFRKKLEVQYRSLPKEQIEKNRDLVVIKENMERFPPGIRTQEEYDQLPSGTKYKNLNTGEVKRKK